MEVAAAKLVFRKPDGENRLVAESAAADAGLVNRLDRHVLAAVLQSDYVTDFHKSPFGIQSGIRTRDPAVIGRVFCH